MGVWTSAEARFVLVETQKIPLPSVALRRVVVAVLVELVAPREAKAHTDFEKALLAVEERMRWVEVAHD